MVGKTPEETGYQSSVGVAKFGIVSEIIEDLFITQESTNGK